MATQTLQEIWAIEDAGRHDPYSPYFNFFAQVERFSPITDGNNVAWIEQTTSPSGRYSWYSVRFWNGSEIINIPEMQSFAGMYWWTNNSSIELVMSGNNVVCYYSPSSGSYPVDAYWWNGTTTVNLGEVGPQLSGNNMAWAASDGSDTEIYFWNGYTTVQLTHNSTSDSVLQLSGNTVTWQNSVDGKIYSITVKDGGFLGTPGLDLINAEDGNDVVTSDFASLQPNDKMDGGVGTDMFILTVGTTDTNVTINAGSLTNQISSLAGLTVVNFEQFDLARFIGTVNFIGSTGSDWIKSGRGNDFLDGGLGEDQLMGGLGNDTYIVDNIRDSVTENGNEGNDLVQATVNTTLTNNVENLTLLGTANLYGTGNNLDNTLTGNSGANLLKGLNGNDTLSGGTGNDTLIGGLGNDRLVGEGGADQFLFGSGSAFKSSNLGVDTLTDFTTNSDKIALSKVTFNALISPLGTPQSAEFIQINSLSNELSLVGSSSAKIVYNVATGNLFYNPDGAISGLSNGGQFAVLSNRPNLSATDFLVQA